MSNSTKKENCQNVFSVHIPPEVKTEEIGKYIEKELSVTPCYDVVIGTGSSIQLMATKVKPKGLRLEEVSVRLGNPSWPFEISMKWAIKR